MFNWFRRKRPSYPTFTVEVLPKDIRVTADWANPKTMAPKEVQDLAEKTAKMIIQITNFGPAFNEFQSAVGRTAQHREDQKFSNMVFYYIKEMINGNHNTEFVLLTNELCTAEGILNDL